ncbi:MAG: LysR family glycine cleavage system transcriptional activator [Halieaceae bacterium]|jgi:LysR family glycine cleavage system transcriptional activator
MALAANFPLNTLRAFEAVGRHCHVRRAAEELCLTHAAVSRQIRNLEDRIGAALFTREGNRMQLTAAGRRFLIVVQGALQQLQQGVLYLDPESLAGELVVAATPSISANWVLDVISAYRSKYPEVVIKVDTIEPRQRTLPHQLDVAICLGEPQVGGRQSRKLYQEHYFPVCSPTLLHSEHPVRVPADLKAYTLLYEQFNHWSRWFDLQGVDPAPPVGEIKLDYGYQVIEAARRGMGIGLADQLEVNEDLRSGKLVRILDEVLPVDESIYLITEKEQQQTIRARLFVEELENHLAENLTPVQ